MIYFLITNDYKIFRGILKHNNFSVCRISGNRVRVDSTYSWSNYSNSGNLSVYHRYYSISKRNIYKST